MGEKLLSGDSLKSVAFRFFSAGEGTFAQRQLPPLNEDGSLKTLGQALEVLGFRTKLVSLEFFFFDESEI